MTGLGRRTATVVGLLVPMAVVVVLALAGADRDRAADPDGASSLAYGVPVTWVEQDQSARDPEYPVALSLLSPWEYPTTISPVPLALAVLSVLAVEVLLLVLVLAIVRWSRARPAVRWAAVLLAPLTSLVVVPSFYWDAQDTAHLPSALFAVLVVNANAALLTCLATRDEGDRRFRHWLLGALAVAVLVELALSVWTDLIADSWVSS